ncbi:MAG: MBL fold metallo-hydrolase [Acidimicrobiales bacterium]
MQVHICGVRGSTPAPGSEFARHGGHTSCIALDIPHKGGRTFGYRVSDDRSAIAYLSDHGPSQLGEGPDGWGPYHEAACALAEGVDLLIHDAQHTAAELTPIAHFGHSSMDYPVRLAELAGAKGVLLFHHDPDRTEMPSTGSSPASPTARSP